MRSDPHLTPEDVNAVLMDPDEIRVSRSSGRPVAFGYAPDGRYICVVYEEIDEHTWPRYSVRGRGLKRWPKDKFVA